MRESVSQLKVKIDACLAVTKLKKALLRSIGYTLTCTLMLSSLLRAVFIAMHLCRMWVYFNF